MKLKVLVGVLVFLIVLNFATIGTFLYMHFTRPEMPPMADDPGFPPRDHAQTRKPWLHRLPSEDREVLARLLGGLHKETEGL